MARGKMHGAVRIGQIAIQDVDARVAVGQARQRMAQVVCQFGAHARLAMMDACSAGVTVSQ